MCGNAECWVPVTCVSGTLYHGKIQGFWKKKVSLLIALLVEIVLKVHLKSILFF